MTDDRLIALIDERSPEALSDAELAEIRARLKQSSAVREALAGRVQLEQALHQSVGQFRLPLKLLLAKAAAIEATSTVAKLLGWGTTTGLVIGLVSVGTLVALRGAGPQHGRPQAVARLVIDEPESPSDVQPGDSPNPILGEGRDGISQMAEGHAAALAIPVDQAGAVPNTGDELFFADATEASVWRDTLESVAGEVSQRTVDDRTELVLRGTQVLRHDWPAAGRMRLKLADHDRFRIHFSHTAGDVSSARPLTGGSWPAGPSSLTLEYFAHPRPLWVAWLAARRANQMLPEMLALAAHDQGRLSQLGAGTIDVGYDQGRIVLTHGDTELLAAPLSGLPDRIVFEGQAVVHGLQFADGLIAASRPNNALLEPAGLPADREWQPELPTGAKWNLLPAGRVELLAEDSQADARAACSLGELRQAVLELEDPLPGTGIYLSDNRGDAVIRLAFVPGEKPNQVCFALTAQDHSLVRLPEGPTPLCPARAWFKLLSTDGALRAWFSCDGDYWSPVFGPDLPLAAPLSTVGVYCLAGPGTRSIRVAHLGLAGPGLSNDARSQRWAVPTFCQRPSRTSGRADYLVVRSQPQLLPHFSQAIDAGLP